MLVQPNWPDVEDVMIAMLSSVATTVTVLPPDMTQPVIQVNRVGGPADLITDTPTVVVGCYAPDRATAMANAKACQQIVLASRRKRFADGVVDTASVVAGIQTIPYEDPNVKRVIATYRLAFRRPFAVTG